MIETHQVKKQQELTPPSDPGAIVISSSRVIVTNPCILLSIISCPNFIMTNLALIAERSAGQMYLCFT